MVLEKRRLICGLEVLGGSQWTIQSCRHDKGREEASLLLPRPLSAQLELPALDAGWSPEEEERPILGYPVL